MERISRHIREVVEAEVIRAEEGNPGCLPVDWDASVIPKACLSSDDQGDYIHHQPAFMFVMTVLDPASRTFVTASVMADLWACRDPFVRTLALNLWYRVQFDLVMQMGGLTEMYDELR